MSALQELSLFNCCNLPFRRSTVDMPNLKTFMCESDGYPDYLPILPTSLTTLVVEPLLGPYVFSSVNLVRFLLTA